MQNSSPFTNKGEGSGSARRKDGPPNISYEDAVAYGDAVKQRIDDLIAKSPHARSMAELNEDKLAELRAVYNQPQGGMSEAVSKMDDIRKRIVTLKERRSVRNTGHVGDVDVELWQQEQELLALQRGLEGTDVDTLLQQRIQVARSKIEAMSKIVSERVSEDGLNAKEEDLTLLFDILQLLEQQSDASIVTWVEEHLELLGDVEKAEGTSNRDEEMHNASPLYNSAVDNSDEESKSPPRPLTVERLKQHLDELEALRDRRLHDPRLRDPRKKHKMTSLLQRIDRTKTMLHAAEERNREAAPPVPVVDAVASFDGEKWEIKASGGQHFEVDNVAGKKAGHLVLKEIPSDSGGFVGIDTDVIPIRTGKLLEGGALIRHDKGAHSWTFAYLPEKLSL